MDSFIRDQKSIVSQGGREEYLLFLDKRLHCTNVFIVWMNVALHV